MDSLFQLKTGSAATFCKIHPIVIFNILDHFIRRNEDHRVIGTLIGIVHEGVVEIKNSFPVPHTEGDQVGVDMEFHRNMLDLHHKVSPKEVIVGWYATGADINENSVMIHEFYGKEMGPTSHSPVHLTVDTNLTNYTLSVKAYHSTTIQFNEKDLGAMFLPLPHEIQTFEAEKIGVELMRGKGLNEPSTPVSDLESLESSIHKLGDMLDSVQNYVNGVLSDKIKPDAKIGRFLADAISALPKIEPSALEKMFNNTLQDLLLVVYLANLTRTQLTLAEKLQRVV